MAFTAEQVAARAPDPAAAANGRRTASPRLWKNLGCSDRAVWGECQGSAVYQVKVDLGDLTSACTCPSRKVPCKHGLGLMFLAVDAGNVPAAAEPEWVAAWLEKRSKKADAKKEKDEQRAAGEAKPVDAAAQAKRVAARDAKVREGIARLELWMHDLVRGGLAGVEARGPAFWEEQARRLVDAQAGGLAGRLRRIGEIPGSGEDWPRRLLRELGQLSLLTRAYERLDELDPELQAAVRQLVGWTISQDDLASAARVRDRWLVLGQSVEEEDRGLVQRNWLLGESTRQTGIWLQFSFAGRPFEEALLPGTEIEGELVRWPGAAAQRCRIVPGHAPPVGLSRRLPGWETHASFLRHVAEQLARQPWQDQFLVVLREVRVVPRPGAPWLAVDRDGQALPFENREEWELLALTGGHPADLAGIWSHGRLSPIGVGLGARYHVLQRNIA